MKPVIDLSKEYGIVLDGGGARGAYQIGAWRALKEAGIQISAVAGTSVGALNGALICMDDLEKAEEIWGSITFSHVMNVEDSFMERLFERTQPVKEILRELFAVVKDGGVDITPLKNLINEVIDEDKIRNSGKDLCLLTFSLTEMKELELSMDEIPKGQLGDMLLASAYLLGFKNEKLHGSKYLDGGVLNNVPLGTLLDRGYRNIIQVRIYGPGMEPRVKHPDDLVLYEIAPRVKLGSIIEFQSSRSNLNMRIGYYDAKRLIYGLEGLIYYIEQTHEECYYEKKLEGLDHKERREILSMLRLPSGIEAKELYVSMLEASAKLLHIPKYKIYTVDELKQQVMEKYQEIDLETKMPYFIFKLIELERDEEMNLKGRHFLTLKDFSAEEIMYLIDLAADLKAKKKEGITGNSLKGKNIALLFEKPSTRTRCAFTVGAADEGGIPTYLSGNDIQLGHKESIKDTARVLGRMFDGIEFRGFAHEHVEILAKYSGVPVWNGLTDQYHPTQILADFLTMKEHFGYLKGLKFVYLGDGRNNMANSLMIGCGKMGIHFVIVAPKCLWPEEELTEECRQYASASGGSIECWEELSAVKDADVLYTDVWCSMGEEDKAAERIALLQPYQINRELLEQTGKTSTIFMHCLPAVKGKEVTEEVFESDASVVFDEAENRLHTIKAVMVATLGEER
ncbi:MAG: ornithine carbamoyltransferase [Lachnospiraceae bacterium]